MEKSENKEKDDESARLSDRLGRRFKEKQKTVDELGRLGNRLARRVKGYEGREEFPGTLEDLSGETRDFFVEFLQMSEEYSELKDTKLAELRQAIAQAGLRNPGEVLEELKKEKRVSKIRETKKKWITH